MSAAAGAPGVSPGTRVRMVPEGRAGPRGRTTVRNVLLTCGILSSLLYGAMITLIRYEGSPWIGLWERITIYGFLVWVAVLAVALLRTRRIQT